MNNPRKRLLGQERPLTPREAEILRALVDWMEEHSYPPTIREIGEAVGFSSTRTTYDYLTRLENMGYIRRQRDRSRAIEVLRDPDAEGISGDTKDPMSRYSIPILGEVAAGYPIASERPVEGGLILDPSLVPDDRTFLMKVRGESMIDAHICDGDLILVQPKVEATNGEIVVVRIEGEVTLKRFYR
ncbi:MAG TPA: transcriptional repressor LexA, partial [Candidatus Krumholzibacteria bacterium]